MTPTCWIFAGPNGAGKTTFALEYLPLLPACKRFINADLIAAGLSPLAPESQQLAASRIFLREMQACIRNRESFAFETTLSGRAYLRVIQQLKSQGWQVEMIYLALPSAEMSRLRVAERVAHGGHHVPDTDVQRRFPRSLRNLLLDFSYSVDNCQCFMNSGVSPEPVFEQQGSARHILHHAFYQDLLRQAGL